MYITRNIEKEVLLMSSAYPVVTITGPRQSGKTTMCKHLFPELPYFSFENPDIRLMAKTDPRGFLSKLKKGAILDEIQNVPQILSYLLQIVDEHKNGVNYILTGSNNFSLINKISQSLAGRTAVLKLLPFSFSEMASGLNLSTDEIIFRGFYPANFSSNISPIKIYRNYYETYLERDLRELINIKELGLFQKFVKLCAGRIANLLNASALASEVGVSVKTIQSWIAVLEASFVLFRLQPYYENISKRLIKSPKLYFYDTGLASYLLGIDDVKQLERDPLRGALFENMIVAEHLKQRFNKGLDANFFFYRDSHHNEVDLIYRQANRIIAVEIKSAQTFHIDFLKNLLKIQSIFPENLKQMLLVYDGDTETTIKDVDILNFRRLA
jgi:uncharacterized protein